MLRILCGYPPKDIRERFYKEITECANKKKRSFLIVPEQQVLAYEDESVRALPDCAPLYFTVSSFSLLSDIAQRRYGGLSYKTLSKPIKTLYMWRAIREARPMLKVYRRTTPEGITGAMLECIDELKASGITPEGLSDAADFLSDQPSFADKLKDISLIFTIYKELIGNRYSDSNDSLAKLNAILREHKMFSGFDIFIDSFTDFTPIQTSVLTKIIKSADNVSIALPIDPENDTSIQFESVRRTFSELTRLAESFGIRLEIDSCKKKEQASLLSRLHDDIWKTDAIPYTDPEPGSEIEIYSCRDIHDEVATCINLIKRTLYNGGKLSDIAIIARNPASYEKLLMSAGSDAGISVFTSDRSPLSDRVFVTYITGLLRMIGNSWQREDVLAHLKCGLCTADEADILKFELYTVRWRLNGKKQLVSDEFTAPYKSFDRHRKEDEEYTSAANRIRENVLLPILRLENKLKEAKTVTEMLSVIFEHLEYTGIRARLASLSDELASSGDLKGADQTARVYRSVIRLFDDTAFALESEAAIPPRELCSLLELLFSSADLGSIPTRQDEVTLADASLYRSFGHKTVILIGVSDGEFPRATKPFGLISDSEKERLRNEGLPFATSAFESASREYLYFWRAIGAAKEKLILTFPEKNSADTRLRHSPAIDKICYLCPSLKIKRTSEMTTELLYDPQSMLTSLSVNASNSKLYRMLCEYCKEHTESEERLMRGNGSLTGDHILSQSAVSAYVRSPMYISPTALEKYNECAFAYFCNRILGLDSGEKNEFNAAVAGNLIHKVLENYMRGCEKNGALTDKEEIEALCSESAKEYYEAICPAHLRENERIKIAFERSALNASLLAMYVGKDLEGSGFRPTAYEFDTGVLGGLRIRTDENREAVISGRIDRVDTASHDGNNYLRVIDYKSGAKKFSLDDLRSGIELQLPLYLSSILKGQKFRPGGFLYLSSAIPRIDISSASELADHETINKRMLAGIEASGILNSLFAPKKSTKLKGYAEEELLQLLSEAEDTVKNTVTRIYKGDFTPSPTKSKNAYSPCEYCRFSAVCRAKKG